MPSSTLTFPQFTLTFVNGRCGDPAVFGYLPRIGKGWLFDLGSIDKLSNKDALRVSHVAISHTHIDHFIGFDRLVRVNIPHFRRLTLFGPAGLARNVQAKLRGYTWNLLQPEQLRFTIHEISRPGLASCFHLSNTDSFAIHSEGDTPLPIDMGHGLTMVGVPLSHGSIPSIAYKLTLAARIKVAGDKLVADGIDRGPWIQQLQLTASQAFKESPHDWQAALLARLPRQIVAGEKTLATADILSRYFSFALPESVGYITDIGFTAKNLATCKAELAPVTHLLCEASFLEQDEDRAAHKAHLTTGQAAKLAEACGCQSLHTFHYSNIYGGDVSLHQEETAKLFTPVSSPRQQSEN